jgi:hypothetical protein
VDVEGSLVQNQEFVRKMPDRVNLRETRQIGHQALPRTGVKITCHNLRGSSLKTQINGQVIRKHRA